MSRKRERRAALRLEYGSLFDEVSSLLYRIDPIGINLACNPDEYEAEAGTIIPRLKEASSPEGVEKILFEEFTHWFTPGTAKRVTASQYAVLGQEIWKLWSAVEASARTGNGNKDC